eukprot:gene6212-151_t
MPACANLDKTKAISQRQRYESQKNENQMVLEVPFPQECHLGPITVRIGGLGVDATWLECVVWISQTAAEPLPPPPPPLLPELERIEDDGAVYKLIGPALMQQDKEDAIRTVKSRMGYIDGELERQDKAIKQYDEESDKKRNEPGLHSVPRTSTPSPYTHAPTIMKIQKDAQTALGGGSK